MSQSNDAQISHGLNLVLKLREPARMRELLIKIHQAQPKIDAGLGELNFVHFARFLPTYDNTALQVITEFDGPFEPYVLDFVIEIGDVFDMLLGFTQGTEHLLPIAEHPDEFLAFVRDNNTVRVPGLPDNPNLSVYSAYPDLTTLDIIGPRDDLPIPKADRWITPVDKTDVQGNILRGFPAERVQHFVLEVLDASKARAWLADRATAGAAMPDVPRVTSDEQWPIDQKPQLMLNVGLTHAGMQALGIRPEWLAPFPEAFRQGALARANDNLDIGGNAPDGWWLGGPAQERAHHVMVSLYHSDQDGAGPAFVAAAAALRASLGPGGFRLIDAPEAARNGGSNWFGYADSITNPRVASAEPAPVTDLQPASTAGEFVLGADYRNIYGGSSLGALPAPLATNGSFCAVRVLAQDVDAFQTTLKNESARLGRPPEWLAARLMGRWYGGAPLSLYPDAPPPPDSAGNTRNDFDYAPSYEYPNTAMDHNGRLCPVGAHIRRSNARSSRIAGARYARRLMRRGMHYDRVVDGTPEKGLFGLFMCADLERQFEFIQRQWMNGDRFASGLRGTRDPFVGTAEGGVQDFEIPMPDGTTLKMRLPPFVRTRGSLYLFMPGLKALRDLDRFATPNPPSTTGAQR